MTDFEVKYKPDGAWYVVLKQPQLTLQPLSLLQQLGQALRTVPRKQETT